MAEMYKNIKTGVKAELVEINEKASHATLKKEDGKFTAPTLSSFEKYWKLISSDDAKTEKKPIEEKKAEPKQKKEEPKSEKKQAEPKEPKQKKDRVKKETLPVRETLEKRLVSKKVEYKNVGKRVRILVDGKTELYFIPNRSNARMYIKESSKYFDSLSKILTLSDNANIKSAYKKTAIIDFATIEKLF